MKSFIFQLICLSGLLVFSTCSEDPEADPGAVIETAIPNGLVPGSALTLKGREFGAVTSVQFANTSVASGQFMRTATNELMVKVPIGTQAGDVRVAGEKGPGQPKQMALLTGGYGLTADNVSTNVNTVTQGYFSDSCSPWWFSYCLRGSCLRFYNSYGNTSNSNPTIDCGKYYNFTTEQIAGATFNVYKDIEFFTNANTRLILKFERNKNGAGFTGFVIMEIPNGSIYFGNVLKNGDIIGYSVDGSELKLCKAAIIDGSPDANGVPYGSPCRPGACNACS